MAIGTPVQLGGNAAATGLGTTATLTTTGNITTGDLVVVFAGSASFSCTPNSVTDTSGNTYTAGTSIGSAGSDIIRPFYCANAIAMASGGTVTITYATSAGSKYYNAISVSGIATASPKDVEAAGFISTGTTTPSIATGTLAQADELVCGYILVGSASKNDAFTQASGFTANTNGTAAVPTSILRSAYQIVASTSTVTYAPVLGTSRDCDANVITFKAPGSTDTLFAMATF